MEKTATTAHISNAIVAFKQNCEKEFNELNLGNLSLAQEKQLIKLAQQGDVNAFNKVFIYNYKYILTLTSIWQCNRINQQDILSACIDGLMVAINTYNTDKCKFSTFAINNMRRKISELTAYLGTALSFNHSAFYRIRQVDKRLAQGMTITEIANELKISIKQVKVLASYSFTAFNENIKADDVVYVDTNEMYDHLEYLVDTELDKFSKFVLRKYFGLHCKKMTMQEIADKCGCNRLKVLRTLHKALDLLKQLV